jgi:hypothetical protein
MGECLCHPDKMWVGRAGEMTDTRTLLEEDNVVLIEPKIRVRGKETLGLGSGRTTGHDVPRYDDGALVLPGSRFGQRL